MTAVETRHIARDSLFLMAEVEIEGAGVEHRVKVRNLSDGGMMAEGEVPVMRGSRLVVKIRNIGTVPGSVAWTQDNRFGIAFDIEIDPKLARSHQANASDLAAPRFTRPSSILPPETADPNKLRKV